MKKVIISLCIVLGSVAFVNAQGLYVKLQPGYGFGMASGDFGSNSVSTTSISGTITTNELVSSSFGKGFNLGLNIGYMLGEHVGIELGIGYNFGGSIELTSQNINPTTNVTNTDTYSSHQFRLNPALVITTGGTEGLSPYAKFGLVLGLGTKVTDEWKTTANASTQTVEFTGGMPLGLNGAFGVNYHLSSSMAIYGELEVISMSYAPSTKTITASTDNAGVNDLSSYTIKEWTLVDKTTSNTAIVTPSTEQQTFHVPFSSFGINVGIRMSFGGK